MSHQNLANAKVQSPEKIVEAVELLINFWSTEDPSRSEEWEGEARKAGVRLFTDYQNEFINEIVEDLEPHNKYIILKEKESFFVDSIDFFKQAMALFLFGSAGSFFFLYDDIMAMNDPKYHNPLFGVILISLVCLILLEAFYSSFMSFRKFSDWKQEVEKEHKKLVGHGVSPQYGKQQKIDAFKAFQEKAEVKLKEAQEGVSGSGFVAPLTASSIAGPAVAAQKQQQQHRSSSSSSTEAAAAAAQKQQQP